MATLKLNNSESFENPIMGRVSKTGEIHSVKLSKELTPIAFNNKVEELLEEGACQTREEAEKVVSEIEFNIEIYYEKGAGLFAVEQDAVETGTIYSPYTAELCNDADVD